MIERIAMDKNTFREATQIKEVNVVKSLNDLVSKVNVSDSTWSDAKYEITNIWTDDVKEDADTTALRNLVKERINAATELLKLLNQIDAR